MIYAVVNGDPGQHWTEQTFSSRETAQRYIDLLKNTNRLYHPFIEEMPLRDNQSDFSVASVRRVSFSLKNSKIALEWVLSEDFCKFELSTPPVVIETIQYSFDNSTTFNIAYAMTEQDIATRRDVLAWADKLRASALRIPEEWRTPENVKNAFEEYLEEHSQK